MTQCCDYISRGIVHVTPLSAWPKTRCGERGETPDNHYRHGTTSAVSFVGLSSYFGFAGGGPLHSTSDYNTMQAIQQSLNSLLTSLPSSPANNDSLNSHVKQTLSQAQSGANPESWKNQWEFALRKSIFDLAVSRAYSHKMACSNGVRVQATEGKALKDPKTTYYDQLSHILDVTLAFTEHGQCMRRFSHQTSFDNLRRRMRPGLPLHHPPRPPRDPNYFLMLAHLFVDRGARRTSHGGHDPAKRQGPRPPPHPQ